MKVDDEIVELKEWDAVRVPPGTWRGYEAGPEGLEILVIGAPNLGEAPREDVDGQRDWWAGLVELFRSRECSLGQRCRRYCSSTIPLLEAVLETRSSR